MEEIEKRLEMLEEAVARVEKRNARVEEQKAWEISAARVGSIVIVTYLVTALVFWLIQAPHPFLNALIPTVGYYLSTRTLPYVRIRWDAKRSKSKPL